MKLALAFALAVTVGSAVLVAAHEPASAATIVYRVDGHACVVDPDFYWWGDPDAGPGLDDVAGSVSEALCSIVVGPSSVELQNLDFVNFRGRTTGIAGETVDVNLYAHDYGSADYCQCDTDTNTSASNGAYWVLTSSYRGTDGYCDDADCPGSAPGGAEPASNWVVTLQVLLHDVEAGVNNVWIKALSIYSI